MLIVDNVNEDLFQSADRQSWRSLLSHADHLAKQWQGRYPACARIILQPKNIASGIVVILAAILSKRVVLVDEKQIYQPSDRDIVFTSNDFSWQPANYCHDQEFSFVSLRTCCKRAESSRVALSSRCWGRQGRLSPFSF